MWRPKPASLAWQRPCCSPMEVGDRGARFWMLLQRWGGVRKLLQKCQLELQGLGAAAFSVSVQGML